MKVLSIVVLEVSDNEETEFCWECRSGKRRIIHAYLQRAGSDYAEHVYGGCMALPRELYLDEQGRVATRLVREIIAACEKDATGDRGGAAFTPEDVDRVALSRNGIVLGAKTGEAALAIRKDAPSDFFLSADVRQLLLGASFGALSRGLVRPARVNDPPAVRQAIPTPGGARRGQSCVR